MLGWLLAAASVYAAVAFGNPLVIANAVANVWSLGIMHNYSHNAGPADNGERVAILVNMITGIVGTALAAAAAFGG